MFDPTRKKQVLGGLSEGRRRLMASWYARPVFAVRDAAAALDFYSSKIGFSEDWRHEELGRLHIVQVSRAGCEIILSGQWPDDACGRRGQTCQI